MLRVATLALAVTASLVTSAAARPRLQPPQPLTVAGDNGILNHHLADHTDALIRCATAAGQPVVAAAVAVRWDRRARVKTASVRGGGRRFDRCAERALGGRIAGPTAAGSATATITVRTGGLDADAGRTPAPSGLDACNLDSDCTVYFRRSACFPADPMAVAVGALAEARRSFPLKVEACAMGGPQYERRRLESEGRYRATCVDHRCTLHDDGPQTTRLPL